MLYIASYISQMSALRKEDVTLKYGHVLCSVSVGDNRYYEANTFITKHLSRNVDKW